MKVETLALLVERGFFGRAKFGVFVIRATSNCHVKIFRNGDFMILQRSNFYDGN